MTSEDPIRIRSPQKALKTLIAMARSSGPEYTVQAVLHIDRTIAFFIGAREEIFMDRPSWWYDHYFKNIELLTLRQWRTRWVERGFQPNFTIETIYPSERFSGEVVMRQPKSWKKPFSSTAVSIAFLISTSVHAETLWHPAADPDCRPLGEAVALLIEKGAARQPMQQLWGAMQRHISKAPFAGDTCITKLIDPGEHYQLMTSCRGGTQADLVAPDPWPKDLNPFEIDCWNGAGYHLKRPLVCNNTAYSGPPLAALPAGPEYLAGALPITGALAFGPPLFFGQPGGVFAAGPPAPIAGGSPTLPGGPSPTSVPEPSSIAILGAAIAILLIFRHFIPIFMGLTLHGSSPMRTHLPNLTRPENFLCGSRFHFLLWFFPSWRRGWRD